jgi:hypothetical protein
MVREYQINRLEWQAVATAVKDTDPQLTWKNYRTPYTNIKLRLLLIRRRDDKNNFCRSNQQTPQYAKYAKQEQI